MIDDPTFFLKKCTNLKQPYCFIKVRWSVLSFQSFLDHTQLTVIHYLYLLSNYYHTISEGSDILVPLSLFIQSDSRFVLQLDLCSTKIFREELMSMLLVLWILLNSETSKTFADSDRKEQFHQKSGFVGIYFETEAERSIGC